MASDDKNEFASLVANDAAGACFDQPAAGLFHTYNPAGAPLLSLIDDVTTELPPAAT
jgi:hypothetical protein